MKERIETFRQKLQTIEAELGKVIVGQKDLLEQVLLAIVGGGHVLLEGVPGLGKTLLVKTLGQVFDLPFSRIQFTPDLMPADISGTNLIEEGETGRAFVFRQGPVFANLVLADEINRATPKTQSALLEAMQERQVTVAGTVHPLPQPFFVLATQNPLEMEGTYPLPEAQVDRFFFKLWVEFPGVSDLVEILERTTGAKTPEVESVCSGEDLAQMQQLARQVVAAEAVTHYAARLTLATHPDRPEASEAVRRYVRFGSSPRGAQTLLLAGKARALSEGRFNLAFEDVAAVAAPTLRHRMILGFEAEAEGIRPDQLIEELLEEVPREAALA